MVMDKRYQEADSTWHVRNAADIAREVIADIRAIRGKRDTCGTCCRPVGAPYRRSAAGVVIEGCVDAFHGEIDVWSGRPEARAIRARELERLRSLLA
jgi:hypothetical protein